jgi:NADPH:quinone reductase
VADTYARLTKEGMMRAVTITEFGATPAVVEIPTPEPGVGQVLIKLAAAGMNPMDRTFASGAQTPPLPATFPMVLGADCAGVVEKLGKGASKYSVGDNLFGQLLITPLGSAGTYAEYVAVAEDAHLARVPSEVDLVVAASLPTAGATGLALVDVLEPLTEKEVLIAGAGGGVGSFVTQFALNAGGHVIANVRSSLDEMRMEGYGVAETINREAVELLDAVRQEHPEGIDVLIDLVDDGAAFSALASLAKRGATAVSTRYAADEEVLRAKGVAGINFNLSAQMSSELLERLAEAVADGRIVAPPIRRISLDEAPAAFNPAPPQSASGKTVIVMNAP